MPVYSKPVDYQPQARRRSARGSIFGRLPFVRRILAMFLALKDPATPRWGKWAIILAVVYLIMPFDAVPDFIPVLGWLDDLGVISLALFAARFLVKEHHRARAEELLRVA